MAEIHYWHGYDRIIKGLAEYYLTKPQYKVYFHIVGELSGERERQEILPIIKQNALEPYVILYGNMHGNDLDQLFSKADMGIGSLGRHRSGITHIKTLKTENMQPEVSRLSIQKLMQTLTTAIMYLKYQPMKLQLIYMN